MKRRLARETAFQIVYQIDIGKNELKEALVNRLSDTILDAEGKKFCQKLVEGTIEHLSEIDSIIEKYSIGWGVSRMLSVDRNLLRLAVYEIVFCEDIPPKVSVNEAIELAKTFGSEDSAKFINGILGKLVVAQGV